MLKHQLGWMFQKQNKQTLKISAQAKVFPEVRSNGQKIVETCTKNNISRIETITMKIMVMIIFIKKTYDDKSYRPHLTYSVSMFQRIFSCPALFWVFLHKSTTLHVLNHFHPGLQHSKTLSSKQSDIPKWTDNESSLFSSTFITSSSSGRGSWKRGGDIRMEDPAPPKMKSEF